MRDGRRRAAVAKVFFFIIIYLSLGVYRIFLRCIIYTSYKLQTINKISHTGNHVWLIYLFYLNVFEPSSTKFIVT